MIKRSDLNTLMCSNSMEQAAKTLEVTKQTSIMVKKLSKTMRFRIAAVLERHAHISDEASISLAAYLLFQIAPLI